LAPEMLQILSRVLKTQIIASFSKIFEPKIGLLGWHQGPVTSTKNVPTYPYCDATHKKNKNFPI